MANPESTFQKKVLRELRKHPEIWVFTKEAKSIRGLPDVIGCCNGKFFGWELKKCAKEAEEDVGRIVLQKWTLRKIREAGGVGELVHPDNLSQKIRELLGTDTGIH